jgi:hypothetical protein
MTTLETTARPLTTPKPVTAGRWLAASALGALCIVEALASPLVDAHVGYHLPNALLNLALVVVVLTLLRTGRAGIGKTGIVGGVLCLLGAVPALVGGAMVVAIEGIGSGTVGDLAEGLAHTGVLLSILAMVPLAVGMRRSFGRAAMLVAIAAAALVAMVLAGLDDPIMFLVPEALLGLGWLLVARPSHDDRS